MHTQSARRFTSRWGATLTALLCMAPMAHAQVGEVEFSRGVGFAQTPGQTPRTLGKGLELKEGDRLTTSDGGSAIIKLQDGTRMTVRPNSEMVLQQYQFKENATDNSMLMQLVRGGFRAVTGAISKSSPNAARIQTNTATIGIRGTDFDARVCAKDCGAESSKISDKSRPNAAQASARLMNVMGEIHATDAANERRRLVDGGSVYPGDLIETSRGSQAILIFRDDSRVTLGSQTRFRLDNFVFDDKNAGEGRFLASVLKGSVRALTGLIAKANTRNVGFNTATATIGIRGTGLDVICTGPCAGEPSQPGDSASGLTLFAWLGSITVQGTSGPGGAPLTALQVLQSGQGLFLTPQGVQQITNQPAATGGLPRGDQVTPNPNMFSKGDVNDAKEGLFVFVRKGHIELVSSSEILHLGQGEAGFAGANGETARPNNIPKFLEFDKIPLPGNKNALLASVLPELKSTAKACN